MSRKEYVSSVASHLQNMMVSHGLTPEAVLDISNFVDETLQQWQNDISDSIVAKIQKWEEVFGEDPMNFYSLGLRHALDLVRDLPEGTTLPLEEDHRDFVNQLPFGREEKE